MNRSQPWNVYEGTFGLEYTAVTAPLDKVIDLSSYGKRPPR